MIEQTTRAEAASGPDGDDNGPGDPDRSRRRMIASPICMGTGGDYVMMNDMTERGAGTRDDAASPWQFGFGGPRALGGKKSLFCLPSTGPVSDDLQTASSSSNFAVTG
ncbi:hypothetical protein THAOC_33642, partial [Thalassiosira oceanica]